VAKHEKACIAASANTLLSKSNIAKFNAASDELD